MPSMQRKTILMCHLSEKYNKLKTITKDRFTDVKNSNTSVEWKGGGKRQE